MDNVNNITRRRVISANWTNRAGGIGETCRSRCEVTTSEANAVQDTRKKKRRGLNGCPENHKW